MSKIAGAGRRLLVGAVCMVGVSGAAAAQVDTQYQANLEALLKSVEKYQDPYVAVRDGYFSTVGCVHYDGEKIEGHQEYDKGAMGVHFFNPALVGPEVDPMKPPVLIYEPVGQKLHLVAVEYFVPLASGVKARPTLFGTPFQGPMEGHEPIMPQALAHFDLHLWIKDNPYGMFAATNPEVNCIGYDFELLEHPTKLVPEP